MSDKNTDSPTFSEADIAKARKCFERGQELAGKRNYDYAIEMYINGLAHWPEAVDEGHKPCRAAALFRGGKKVGFKDKRTYKTSVKDPKQAMLNAEMLLSKEVTKISHMEAMFKNAARGRFDETVMWIGEILAGAAVKEDKPSLARFTLLRETYEELGDRRENDNPPIAIAAFERAVDAQSKLRALKPNDMDISTDLRDLASKLTILKGKFADADSFRDSMHDGEAQAELHDKDRVVQSDDRMEELIDSAKEDYEEDPTNNQAINTYVDLLCRREDESEEKVAVKVLLDAQKATQEYRYKIRADDIRMRVLRRRGRAAQEAGDSDAVRQYRKDQLRFELKVFKERAAQYPTDMRIRFQYGKRLFTAGQFDEAIPVLQEARNDPKTRFRCSLYIGRCFYEKHYYDQAVDTFHEAIETYEATDDDLGKELHYWLGRAYESGGKMDDALKIYGQLIQWDYKYRKGNVRKRIDDLREGNQKDA